MILPVMPMNVNIRQCFHCKCTYKKEEPMCSELSNHCECRLSNMVIRNARAFPLMKQLDVVVSPPAFVWDPNLTLLSSDFWYSDRQTDRRKSMHKSPPCISTGGLKNVQQYFLRYKLFSSLIFCIVQIDRQ